MLSLDQLKMLKGIVVEAMRTGSSVAGEPYSSDSVQELCQLLIALQLDISKHNCKEDARPL